METKLTQQDINRIVWKACDSLRPVMGSGSYKDYILTLLFVKYLSDVWKEKANELRIKYDGNEDMVKRQLKRERFFLPEQSSFDFLFENRNESNIGELIDIALTKLEDENRSKLAMVFRSISFNSETAFGPTKQRNQILKNLLTDLSELNLEPSHLANNDVIGDSYEYLISMFAGEAGKKAGEFYTPSEVSTLLAKLINPQSGDRICDPACGSGSLLIKVAKEIEGKNYALYGQENNGSTWALARMNMFLHEEDNAEIAWGDTLNNPQLKEKDALMKFDIVVANPPFSLDKWGAEQASVDEFNRFHRGVPPKSKGDYAFISHMIETTFEDKGKVGVIVPHGVLFRGSSEGKIRQQLIDENLLEAVVGLPANLFFGTGIPAAILIFNKAKGNNTNVLFIDASAEFESGKNQNKMADAHIEKIVEEFKKFKSLPALDTEGGEVLTEKFSYRATLKDIQDNEYNLNIPRYIDTFEEEEQVDIKEVHTEIVDLKKQLAETEAKMEHYLKELNLI
ncbi:type I restriction-modification system subunit M [Elizabethkingia anophelis]|uniref:type I restriction-modification system subunit M n=1 Tax=Elizabethkingia anophelis TaxID=1117645 RepID=UPI00099AC352|nr:type I restriction-modification system subunit M [Elizabethkingia anophelis]MCT3662953.1 type I restriction-modification system subunit M [Elizabethkingia anophelis]MCT3734588.1 type I restriction-modification system subunit M [Elizabethkingia anophelis]MDV3871054.1 type I restriction-modification system subunit M [Elizabethkingia anophelis]MDV4086784.1 type I restriction-modification system subunit M [Elizabethkingia anophelis]MDV4129511.1 type I restriction-modification system subunit M [